jgi:hypothetical protein
MVVLDRACRSTSAVSSAQRNAVPPPTLSHNAWGCASRQWRKMVPETCSSSAGKGAREAAPPPPTQSRGTRPRYTGAALPTQCQGTKR